MVLSSLPNYRFEAITLVIEQITYSGYLTVRTLEICSFQMSMTTDGAKAEGKALMSKVEGLRKKIAGKSIPDEKFAAKKAQQFLNNETTLALAIPEAAYVFNYLKIGNVNPKIAKFWREFLKQKQNEIGKSTFDKMTVHFDLGPHRTILFRYAFTLDPKFFTYIFERPLLNVHF